MSQGPTASRLDARWVVAASVAAGALLAALIWAVARLDLNVIATSAWWPHLWPALAIVGLRMTDMCLVVFRTTFVVTGRRAAASVTAAAEGTVWLTAAGLVLADLSPVRLAAYAIGVATGTLIGMSIVRALRLGMVTLRLFAPPGTGELAAGILRAQGYGATVFAGTGANGPVEMVLSVLRRREARLALESVRHLDGVFVTVDSAPGPGSTVSGVAGSSL
jgi:uncharacterized protein YebE (UPF0316 family)